MTEYIVNVGDDGAAAQMIDKFGIEETTVYGYHFTGEEIVRCRDCELFEAGCCEHGTEDWCYRWGESIENRNGFCAWGKRRGA